MPTRLDIAVIALGSNLGDPEGNVLRAMDRLQTLSREPLLRSSLWHSDPVDCPPGSPPFINAAVGLAPRAGETPETLLRQLKSLETEFGRRPKQLHNEARPLDLDLIAFGAYTRRTPELTLPHPRATTRRFVLEPLSEVAPNLVLPGEDRTIKELLDLLPPEPGLRRVQQRP